MIGLQSPRVLVVDDDFNEAKPILDALWQCGIPAVYCDGDSLPESPLKGLRLVFLDLHLSASTSAHAQIQHTLGILRKLIDLDDSAIGIMIWTKHPDQQEEFEQALRERLPKFRPAFIIRSERFVPQGGKITAVRDKSAAQDLFAGIAAALEEQPGHWLLRAWEQQVHDATCSTVSAVMEVASGDPLAIQARLSLTAGNNQSAAQALAALFGGLHQVLSDSVDHISETLSSGPAAQRLWEAVQADGDAFVDGLGKATLNRLLLTSRVAHDDFRGLSGSVYQIADLKDNSLWSPDLTEVRTMFYEMFPKTEREAGFTKSYKAEAKALAEKSMPILVEMSPPCDVAQSKRKRMRLLGGILIPYVPDECKHLDPGGSLSVAPQARQVYRDLPVFSLPGSQGPMRLVVASRLLFAAELTWCSQKLPAFRLRESVVSDLQSWFASHAARPGFYSV